MRRVPLAVMSIVSVGTVAMAAGPAPASEQFRQSFAQRYSAMTPGASTGTSTILEVLDPGEPRSRPSRGIRELAVRFHRGTRFDPSVAKRCDAPRRRLERRGRSACPSASAIGTGRAELRTEVRALESARVTAFSRRRGYATLVEPDRSRAFTLLSEMDGRRVTTRFARQCGSRCGPGDAVITKFRLTIASRAKGSARLIETPPKCPRSERWTIDAEVRYDDGYEERRLRATSPCIRR